MPHYRRPTSPPPIPKLNPPNNQSEYKALIYVIIGLTILSWLINHYMIDHNPPRSPGEVAHEEPVQVMLSREQPFMFKHYKITPLATFSIRALVLSTYDYTDDKEAELSPVDFALGWGKMSDSSVLRYFQISQHNRWYFWRYETKPPISDDYIIAHSGNMHILPATDKIADIVKSVRKNQIIRMQGYLVGITGANNYTWKSSLTRTDSGDHSCEVFWVTNIIIEGGT